MKSFLDESVLYRVAHVVQSLTSMDSSATILSIDGVGAYDFISRRTMFQGDNGDQLILFIRQFYEEPSTFVWEDKLGEVHTIRQGEGVRTRRPPDATPPLFGSTQSSVRHNSRKGNGSSHIWMTFTLSARLREWGRCI